MTEQHYSIVVTHIELFSQQWLLLVSIGNSVTINSPTAASLVLYGSLVILCSQINILLFSSALHSFILSTTAFNIFLSSSYLPHPSSYYFCKESVTPHCSHFPSMIADFIHCPVKPSLSNPQPCQFRLFRLCLRPVPNCLKSNR